MTTTRPTVGHRTHAARRTAPIAGVLFTAFVLAGCGDSDDPPPPVKLTRPGPDYTVPVVQHPLDLSEYREKPCSILTQDQIDRLKLPSTGKTDIIENLQKHSP